MRTSLHPRCRTGVECPRFPPAHPMIRHHRASVRHRSFRLSTNVEAISILDQPRKPRNRWSRSRPTAGKGAFGFEKGGGPKTAASLIPPQLRYCLRWTFIDPESPAQSRNRSGGFRHSAKLRDTAPNREKTTWLRKSILRSSRCPQSLVSEPFFACSDRWLSV